MGSKEDHQNSATDDACVTERDMFLSALDTLAGGLIILDSELRIVAANKLAVTLLDVPAELVQPQVPWPDFVRFAAERGDYGEGTADEQYERVMPLVTRREPYELTRTRPDGVIIEINGRPATEYLLKDLSHLFRARGQIVELKISREEKNLEKSITLNPTL